MNAYGSERAELSRQQKYVLVGLARYLFWTMAQRLVYLNPHCCRLDRLFCADADRGPSALFSAG